MLPEILLADYQYNLPDERIARYPAEPRDSSQLMVYQGGNITHSHFYHLPEFLSENHFLVFNDTKVIPARIFFQKPTGAVIEIFLLHPEVPTRIINDAMQQTDSCVWSCMIGNKKRWKAGECLTTELRIANCELRIRAEWADVEKSWVKFTWHSDVELLPFADVIRAMGEIPLPPYLNRKADRRDSESYQTVYSKTEGAVAAPTAGLHFTERIFHSLSQKGVDHTFVTLHVGAGTFQPVKVQNAVEHTMHAEQLVFTLELVEKLRRNLDNIIAVGTTSVRALESLYWYGVRLLQGQTSFWIEKLSPYQTADLPAADVALEAVLTYMQQENLTEIVGETEIMIFPGYDFKLCQGMITNYHQPGSTLMLLVAAFVGPDWKKIYEEALMNDYRFLSYGDSSLLFGNNSSAAFAE
ncbi:MAG: S-adenosylmethionine:tRNA ribosyltransferase-isomerase [Spirosomataceae bacterium]